jgi:hypothetical protein
MFIGRPSCALPGFANWKLLDLATVTPGHTHICHPLKPFNQDTGYQNELNGVCCCVCTFLFKHCTYLELDRLFSVHKMVSG